MANPEERGLRHHGSTYQAAQSVWGLVALTQPLNRATCSLNPNGSYLVTLGYIALLLRRVLGGLGLEL